jgi:glycosyltransferase involved in cell wall biosynthesis
MPKPHRLLFASIHSYLDPSSGAALATRELLELLAARDWDCRAFTCGVLDFAHETPLEEVLASVEHPTPPVTAALSRGGHAEVFDLESNGVRITLLPTAHSRADKAPTPREAGIFLDLADQVVDRFQPDVLLTYGGHPASLELMRRARARGIAVVFHLHNFGYTDKLAFADVSTLISPSEYSRRHYRRIGLEGPVIPDPIALDRVIDQSPEPKFVTFINPQPDKGVTVFARTALELGARPPDIPILVVEGRATSDTLAELPVDLSSLTNLSRMANTPDPRDFYRVSRAVLMPSLWRSHSAVSRSRRWPTPSQCWPSTAAPSPRRWATPDSSSSSPTAARRAARQSRHRTKSPHGSPRSSASGTTPRSRPATALLPRPRRSAGIRR